MDISVWDLNRTSKLFCATISVKVNITLISDSISYRYCCIILSWKLLLKNKGGYFDFEGLRENIVFKILRIIKDQVSNLKIPRWLMTRSGIYWKKSDEVYLTNYANCSIRKIFATRMEEVNTIHHQILNEMICIFYLGCL